MISVIIPLYNKEKQIRATLESVLTQRYQDFEIVIVNDGCTDSSVEKVAQVQDPRIRLIHQENAGVSAARNRGIEEARGEFIAFLDADDRWKPKYLQTQYELTQLYPECSVFACNYELVDARGQVRPTVIRMLPFAGEHGVLCNYFEVASHSNPPLWTSAVMVRKEAILAIGGFPLGIRSGEDLLTWARLACKFQIAYNKRVLAQFISTPSQSLISKAEQRLSYRDEVLEQLFELCKNYHSKIIHLKSYFLHWYRIQAMIFLECGNKSNARKYAMSAMKEGGSKYVFGRIVIASLLPQTILKFILFRRH